MYKIPLSPQPNQTLTCTIPINGDNVSFKFKFWYNEQAQYWLMSIFDSREEKEILSNIPLLFSYYKYFNILCQFGYMRIGMAFVYPKIEDLKSMPDDKNLGTNYLLIWGDNNV